MPTSPLVHIAEMQLYVTTQDLLLGRPAVLRSLRHQLPAKNHGHHTIDRLEERHVRRRARRPPLKGRERAVASQTYTGTVSDEILG